MQSMKRQRNLYFKYGTCTPDREFRTIYINGIPKVVTVREAVKYKERRVKEIEAQKQSIMKCREFNLKRKAEKKENYNPNKMNIKDIVAYINRMGTV